MLYEDVPAYVLHSCRLSLLLQASWRGAYAFAAQRLKLMVTCLGP